MILTVASKKTGDDAIIHSYLTNRINDYKNYKNMFSSVRLNELRNDYDYENDNLYQG